MSSQFCTANPLAPFSHTSSENAVVAATTESLQKMCGQLKTRVDELECANSRLIRMVTRVPELDNKLQQSIDQLNQFDDRLRLVEQDTESLEVDRLEIQIEQVRQQGINRDILNLISELRARLDVASDFESEFSQNSD